MPYSLIDFEPLYSDRKENREFFNQNCNLQRTTDIEFYFQKHKNASSFLTH